MADTSKQMAEFARELWENYIKPKFIEQFTDTVTYYMATVVTNDGNNRATIKRPFDDPYQVTYLDDMAGLEAGDTVLVLRFGNGTNNANHIIFGKGNGNMNYTAANATQLANAAIKTIEYGVGTSPTSHSDITSWSSDTPQWEAGKYIWQRTSTNDSTYTYTCIQGAAGQPGAAGYNTATVYLYQRATSTPSKPTNNLTYTFSTATLTGTIDNNWDTVIPTGTNPIYVIAATAFSDTDTDLITTSDWSSPVVLAQNGTNGSPGTNGINTATVYLYQRKATIPNKPSNTLTYTFATGALTGTIDNDWSTTIPSGTDPLFVTFATAASTTATDTIDSSEWVTPEILAENGEDGTDGTDGTDGADGQMLYATCSTGASTAAKVATLASGTLTLTSGSTVSVTFTYANTAADATLNIASTGAKTIRAAGANLTATSEYNWTAGATVIFIYDGTYWQMDGTASLRKADDASKVATDYISNVGNTGIEVSGNNATAKVQIEDTVKVIADSTHFTEMTDSGFDIHVGSATEVTGRFGTRSTVDGTKFDFISFPDPTNTFSLALLETVTLPAADNYAQYGALLLADGDNHRLLQATKGQSYGGGYINIYYGDATNTVAAQLGKMSYTNSYGTLINQEPTLFFKDDNDNYRSFYSLHRAYIDDGNNHNGFVVYGNTPNHGITVDYITSGRINFYVDTVSIGYATITSSDERMKTDIEPIDERYKRAVGSVELKDFHFDFNDSVRADANLLRRFGTIAQDVISALEEAGLDYRESELVETLADDNGEYYVVNYTPFLITRLAADEDRIKELEEKNAELEARLAAIETKLGM